MDKFYLGCDVSKGYADFIILNEDKQTALESFQLDDTPSGHQQLCKVLDKFSSEYPGSVIYSAVESTGGYENNWFNRLWEFNGKSNTCVARVNPFGTNHNSKASISRIITDKNAARNIAEYLINQKKKIVYKKTDKFSSLRKQWTFVKMLTKQRTQLYNQLGSIVYIANPEVLVYCKDVYPNWLLKVLHRYPTARELSKAKITALTSIPYLRECKALSLIEKAKNSVASSTDDITANLVKSLVKQIIHLDKTINKQSKFIADNCQLPEIQMLKSFKGIGDYSSVGLLIELYPVENFSNTKKIASFFGLHPIWKQSGDGQWGMQMSKHGRKQVRAILYMVTKSAIVHNPLIKEIYVRHLQRGMNKTAAIGACMHKILRIVFGMLKNKENFDPEKDRTNSQKKMKDNNSKKTHNNKLRRYQSLDSDAPISKRQTKKRKEQEISQNERSSFSAGSIPSSSDE